MAYLKIMSALKLTSLNTAKNLNEAPGFRSGLETVPTRKGRYYTKPISKIKKLQIIGSILNFEHASDICYNDTRNRKLRSQ